MTDEGEKISGQAPRRVTGRALDALRAALTAFTGPTDGEDDHVRSVVRETVLAGNADLSELISLFNRLAVQSSKGAT